MNKSSLVAEQRLIVDQDRAIRQALTYREPVEYFITHFKSLNEKERLAFVAAMSAILHLEIKRNRPEGGAI